TLPPRGIAMLASALHLDAKDLTLSGSLGRRIVFGCSSALKTTLAPDHGSLTFMSRDELTNRWIVAIRLSLNRDWTWDGLEEQSVVVKRDGQAVGSIELKRMVNGIGRVRPNRSRTELIFLDVIDPTPSPGQFPLEMEVSYKVAP